MRPARQTPAQMQAACDAFNAKHQVGDQITFYTGPVGENPKVGRVQYAAQILSGHTAVVYVAGAGCVALTHVSAAPVHIGGDA